MFPKYYYPVFLLVVSLIFLHCTKQSTTKAALGSSSITAAKKYFNTSILTPVWHPNVENYRAAQSRFPVWDSAETVTLATGPAVIVPVKYRSNLYVSSVICRSTMLNLSDLTKLIFFRDSNNEWRYSVCTLVPDSNSIKSGIFSTGILISEDWQGNSLQKPQYFSAISSKPAPRTTIEGSASPDFIQSIQVCNDIVGYNYSVDDPSGGYSWVETSCTTYSFPSSPLNGPGNPGSLPLPSIWRPSIFTVELAPPSNPITSISDYFKCFSNASDGDHSYSVMLAVEQPVTGSRQPWTWSENGLGSSLSGGNPFNVGHTFLIFTENSGGSVITRNVGFYPQSMVTPASNSAQGVLNNDDNTPYDISLNVTVTSSQFYNMLNYVSQGNNPGYMYDLNSNNCTTFALDAMDAGGISIPATIGTWAFGGQGLDPGDLGEDLRNMQLSSNMTRNTVNNAHPNAGACNY